MVSQIHVSFRVWRCGSQRLDDLTIHPGHMLTDQVKIGQPEANYGELRATSMAELEPRNATRHDWRFAMLAEPALGARIEARGTRAILNRFAGARSADSGNFMQWLAIEVGNEAFFTPCPGCTAPVRFGGWRYTAAKEMADTGVDFRDIQAVTGHKTLEMAQRLVSGADQKRASKRAQQRRERNKL